MRMHRAVLWPLLATVLGAAALIALAFVTGGAGTATQDLEAQALQIERQLLCPRCTNVRLDQCELPICADMRGQIREQLAGGEPGDGVLLFFSNRYGERVLADLPRSGFNLVLFGWVGGSIVLVALGGGAMLWRLRRTARPAPALSVCGTLTEADDDWLSEQLRRERGGA